MLNRNRKCLWHLSVLLVAFLLWSPLLLAQSPSTRPATQQSSTWTGPFFFIQMSDPQFGMYSANKDFVRETENYEKAIAAANKLKPSFVVITGDLINKGQDPAQLAELRRISAKLDPAITLHLLPGNHDVETIPTAATLAFYRKEIGKDYYSWDFHGCHFVGINSTILMRPDLPDEIEKQMAWLKEDLETASKAKPKYTILFGHHPLFLTRVEDVDTGNAIPTVRRKTILEMLTSNHAMYMFAGHLHRNAAGRAGEFEMTSTGPVGKPNGPDPSGFRIIKVLEGRIEHQYVPLDQVPESVTLTSGK
jgi:3',5'-cyclic AMP phosphodiesterase CpdA